MGLPKKITLLFDENNAALSTGRVERQVQLTLTAYWIGCLH